MKKLLVFIKRIFLVISTVFFVNSMVFAKGDDVSKLLLSTRGTQIQLFELNLDSGVLTKLVEKTDYSTGYFNLEKVDNNRFLFENYFSQVGIYHLEHNQEQILFEKSSACPVYFEATGEILFSKTNKVDSGFEEYLYISNLDGSNPTKLKKLARGTKSKCPIKLSNHEALVYLSYEKINEGKLMTFNVKERTFSEKKMPCEPLFGLNNQKLLCMKNKSYFITDYEGQKLEDLEFLNKSYMLPMAAIRETNSIVVMEYRERVLRNTIVNLWLLDLDTQEAHLLAKRFGISKKGAIYLKD